MHERSYEYTRRGTKSENRSPSDFVAISNGRLESQMEWYVVYYF